MATNVPAAILRVGLRRVSAATRRVRSAISRGTIEVSGGLTAESRGRLEAGCGGGGDGKIIGNEAGATPSPLRRGVGWPSRVEEIGEHWYHTNTTGGVVVWWWFG